MNNEQISSINRIPTAENTDFPYSVITMCNAAVATVAGNAGAVKPQGGSHYQNSVGDSEMSFAPDAAECARRRQTMKNEGFRQFQKLLRLAETRTDMIDEKPSARILPWSSKKSVDGTLDVLLEKTIAELARIASDWRTPAEILARLSQHPNADLRSSVSDNRSTPTEVIWALAKDSDPNVRYQLAENPHLPLDLLVALRDDEHPYVACRAGRTISRLQAN
jgi:hypothetical protein